jgi:hypothetical protein
MNVLSFSLAKGKEENIIKQRQRNYGAITLAALLTPDPNLYQEHVILI